MMHMRHMSGVRIEFTIKDGSTVLSDSDLIPFTRHPELEEQYQKWELRIKQAAVQYLLHQEIGSAEAARVKIHLEIDHFP